jgi:hypothetical protein
MNSRERDVILVQYSINMVATDAVVLVFKPSINSLSLLQRNPVFSLSASVPTCPKFSKLSVFASNEISHTREQIPSHIID